MLNLTNIKYVYDSFGIPRGDSITECLVKPRHSDANLVNQSSTTKTPLGFQGKYYDVESRLNYFYHRYYNPAIGRFTTEDPIGLNGGLNLNSFVWNNSVNFSDPLGTFIVIPYESMSRRMSTTTGRFNDWSVAGIVFQGSAFGLFGRIEVVRYETKCQRCFKVLMGGGGAGQVLSGFAGITFGEGKGFSESKSSGSAGFSYGQGFRASGHSVSFTDGGGTGYSVDLGFGKSVFPYELSGYVMTEIFKKCWNK